MSTIFAVPSDPKTVINCDKEGNILDTLSEDNFIEVAFRGNGITLSNPLSCYLPDDVKVYPLDNTAQGIYNMGHIRVCLDLQELRVEEKRIP